MIHVDVSFFGPVRKPWPESSRRLELSEGATVESVLQDLGFQARDLKRMAALINGERRSALALLEDGDELHFILMAGGG